MAQREVIALNESTPQLEAAQSGDTYLMPRDTEIVGTLTATFEQIGEDTTYTSAPAQVGYILLDSAVTFNYASASAPPAVRSEVVNTIQTDLSIFGGGFLFWNASTFKNDDVNGSRRGMGAAYTVYAEPVFEAVAGSGNTTGLDVCNLAATVPHRDFISHASFKTSGAGTPTLACNTWVSFESLGQVATGATIQVKHGFKVSPLLVATGTVENFVAFADESSGQGNTSNHAFLFGHDNATTPPAGNWGLYQDDDEIRPNRLSGAMQHAFLTQAGNLTLGDTHHTVVFTSGAATLPTAATANSGRHYTVYNATGSNMTVGGTLLDGASSTLADAAGAEYVSNGSSGWYRLY